MNKSIPIILKLHDIGDDNPMVSLNGIIIFYNKSQYIVTLHQGLPVKEIIFSINNKKYIVTNFTICGWNDLIFFPFNESTDLFVFKHFVKKQINVTTSYNVESYHTSCKYLMNEFIPINMIPGNPTNMYYKMSCNKEIYESGVPITINNKLIGIIAKTENDILYVIPTIYITNSIIKKDNRSIYTIPCNMRDIVKFGYYKIKNNNIYYNKMNALVPLDCIVAIEGDVNKMIPVIMKCNINLRNNINISFSPFINTLIQNNNNIDISKNTINITSSIIHLIKICYNNNNIIHMIFENMIEKKRFNGIINSINYTFCF